MFLKHFVTFTTCKYKKVHYNNDIERKYQFRVTAKKKKTNIKFNRKFERKLKTLCSAAATDTVDKVVRRNVNCCIQNKVI